MDNERTADFLELLPQLKTLVSTPSELAQARAIIGSVPDLCYSLITIMADLNLLDGEVTTRILGGGNTPGPSNPTPAPPAPAPTASYVGPPLSRPGAYHSSSTPDIKPPPPAPVHAPTPQQQPRANHTEMLLAALPPDQRDAVMAIISMTPEQLRALPPDQQAQLVALRHKFLGTG